MGAVAPRLVVCRLAAAEVEGARRRGDELERLVPFRVLSLEQALEFCREDECVEVTPATVRIRKVELSANARAKSRRPKGSS